jgi:mono/diheme cytochrome c family protein
MKREPGMAYDTKKLNRVFAVLAIIFLAVVLWMALDDYIKPWKVIQVKALKIEQEVLTRKLADIDKSMEKETLSKYEEDLVTAQAEMENHSKEITNLNNEINDIEKKIYVQNMYNGDKGSKAGEYQFRYEHAAIVKDTSSMKKYEKILNEYKEQFNAGRDDLKKYQAQVAERQNKIKEREAKKVELEKQIAALTGERSRTLMSLQTASFETNPVWYLRNAPFIDYLDPTIKIRQIVLDNITEDRYFRQIPKVDRCTTCHVFIDQKGFEDQLNPYKTHPKVDTLAVGLNSAHPMKQFGCTTCHGGEGQRVKDFQSVAHTPQNEKQKKEWEEKYHWHEAHRIPQPMTPLQYTEGACYKCHSGSERIAMADKLNKGRKLIEDFGCYGCHKIEGWDHLGKPGPTLLKISEKTSKEFIQNWIWSPHSFNTNSRMPAFFNQANNSKPEFAKKNIAEVNAITEYLWAKSKKDYKPIVKFTGGNVERGKNLVQTIGCTACHQVEGLDEPASNVKALKGPYLTGLGSKVDSDWLVSWLIKPSHYQADTIMPSFRLSEQEANDIASFLLESKNKKFAELRFAEFDKNVRDELLVGYFSAFETIEAAKEKLAVMSDDEKTMELGYRSINKYGCFSCHDIEGFNDGHPPIGPELSAVGSKFVDRFGFGLQKQVPHTRHDWIVNHLKLPARWDIGVPKAFNDLNRMPNFYLSDEQAELMTTALLGFVNEYVPLQGKYQMTANQKIAEAGKKVANKYNCTGCHNIDGMGGDILAAYQEDLNQGPPWLPSEGHRVSSAWLNNFLRNVHEIRPYVKVRMPTFNYSNDELNKLIAYFQYDADQVAFDNPEKIVWEPGEKEAAVKIFNELACTSCHTGGFNKDVAQAPDLHDVKKRIRPAWAEKWLTNPTAIMPHTTMPNFWEGGTISAVEGVLGNDPKRQIKAVVKYLYDIGNDTYPVPFKAGNKE